MDSTLKRAAASAFLAAAATASLFGATTARAATLEVAVSGARSAKGFIRGGLYDASGRQVAGASVAAQTKSVALRFAAPEPGPYAARIYHDEDGDGRLDTGMFGIPSEGYAFSNDARASFGPPSFAASAVTLGDAPASTIAKLRY